VRRAAFAFVAIALAACAPRAESPAGRCVIMTSTGEILSGPAFERDGVFSCALIRGNEAAR